MMQAAESRHGNDLASCIGVRLGLTPGRRSLSQCKVRSILVVVPDVLVHQSFQMPFIYNDHVVEQIASAIADPTLCDAVLPRAAEAGPFWLDAEAFHDIDDFFVKVGAAIIDQILWRRVVGKGLAELLDNPRAGRMPGDVAVQNTPPV